MKNSNFFKNSILALLPISLGLSVLLGVSSSTADSVEAYTGSSLPTTIYLNDPNESTIRGYYSSLNSLSAIERKGNNLLKNLKTVLSNGQKYYNYDSSDLVWKMYEISDRDWEKSPASSTTYGTYNATENKITNYVYGSNKDYKNNPYIRAYYMDRDQTNVVRAWGNHNQDGTGINREHLWAKAEGFDGNDGAAAGARGDPMHLVAANGYANNIHSNNFYGYVDQSKNYTDVNDKYSTLGHNLSGKSKTVPTSNVDVFEPQDCDKGDIARAIFYMAARYNNIAGKTASQETFDSDNPNLLLTDDLSTWKQSGYTSDATHPGYHGLVTDLLEWNRIDPPDEYEIHRNNLLYTNFTNNRNPFIDFPSWADLIWGDLASSADPVSDTLNRHNTAKTVKSISITSQPSKSVYTEGETFSTAGMVVTVKYTDNTTENVTNYTYAPTGALTLGTDKIVISYGEKTVDVPINVVKQGTHLERYFEKVTSNLTSGSYLITCDELNVAWKTGKSGTANVIPVSFDDNENIIYSAELGNALFTFDLDDGSIFAPNNQYVYNNSTSSGVNNSESPQPNIISLTDGTLSISGSGGCILWCNKNGSSPTFNYYASLTSAYKSLNVYRLVERVADVHPESITVSPSTATIEIDGSRTLSAIVLPLDTTDKSITWSSSNDSIVSVNENGRIVAHDSGQATITATSNDLSSVYGTCVVTVPEPIQLDRIQITGTYKDSYYVGEEFNPDGIVVNAIYAQGSTDVNTEDVTDNTEFTGFDSQTVGQKIITASYNGKITTFTVNVDAVPVEENTAIAVASSYKFENATTLSTITQDNFEIEFSKNSGTAPKYYTSGSAFRIYAKNSITIRGPYKIVGVSFVFGSDDGSNTISVDKGTCDSSTGAWSSVTGEDKLTFTIGGTSGNRRISEIHITYDPNSTTTKELLSISLSGTHKTSFDVDDEFSYEGLVVTAHYNDASTNTVTPTLVSEPDMSSAGEKEVTVSYTEGGVTQTSTYTILVNETTLLTGITLSGTHKTSFFVGDSFVRNGLVVTAHYSDESTQTVSPTAVTGYDMNSVSSAQTVTVYYNENGVEVSANYTIEVKDILPESLAVSNIQKTSYFEGDSFNDSFTTTVTYNNGTKKSVTPTNVDGYDLSTSGNQTVNVEYTEKEVTVRTSYNISVGKITPSTLVITGKYKTEFNVGDTFIHTGLGAHVSFSNGTERDVTPVVSTPDMSTKGTKTVTVSYTENGATASATYDITVNAIVRSVSLDSNNLSVDLHDSVKKSLTATVNADTGADYELDWSVSDPSVVSIKESGNSVSITPLKVGSTTISVEAGGKSAACTINVTSLVSSIKINGENTVISGENIQLSAVVLPNDATESEVEWSSSDSSILAVSGSGNSATVSAVGSSGQKATITARAKDGSGISDSIEITIISIQSIRIEYSGINNDNKVSFAQYKNNQDVDAKVIAVYTNGSTADVTDEATKNFKVNCLQLGNQEITASYAGFNALLTLKVTNEGSEKYVGVNSKTRITRAGEEYNATPLQQAEAWADYLIRLTGGGEFDGPCKLPKDQRKDALLAVWDELNSEYGFMADASKDAFCSDTTTSTKIAEGMNHYKFLCKTYSLTQFVENSQHVKPTISNSPYILKQVKNISIISAVVLGIVGIIVLVVFVTVKKNKKRA